MLLRVGHCLLGIQAFASGKTTQERNFGLKTSLLTPSQEGEDEEVSMVLSSLSATDGKHLRPALAILGVVWSRTLDALGIPFLLTTFQL